MSDSVPTFDVEEIFPRVSPETLPEERMVTMIVTEAEHKLIIAALDQKIWALAQSGTSGAFKNRPAYVRLRAELVDVRLADPDAERLHHLKLPE